MTETEFKIWNITECGVERPSPEPREVIEDIYRSGK